LVKIKYISLVNLIMDKPVVKELIQNELTEENICTELDRILHDEKRIREMKEDYSLLKRLLQQGGNASEQAAGIIVRFLTTSSSIV
ncbi:MAG: lipid-A-disaccharide synthase, partial [Bacteroidota bacterium]|nr:lipid-A-disaccharide synthase [Bacteroidota bacterium]